MQRIILCPRCRVQVKRDNLGEFLCPNCNARLCPKAHIFDGKICTYCGWEDPNYHLWQKEQKARLQRPESKKPDESATAEPEYICPNCGTSVNFIHKDCPSCGLLGAKYRAKRAASTGTAAARPITPIAPLLDKMPSAPLKKESIKPTRSPLIKELAKAEPREWQFPSLRRFVRPVLASLLAGAIITGLVFGGIYVARFFSQNADHSIKLPFQPITSSTTYTLSKIVVPETGGEIKIISPSSSGDTFEAGSQITLMATPGDCYTFNYWDGASGSSETAIIIMDSNKSITANFRLKNTKTPVVSEVKATNNSDISATITWLTDKPTTSQVEYGKTKDYGLSAASNGEPTTSHKVRLTALQPGTTYYFMIKSADECGNQATKAEMLTTLREIPMGERVGERALDFTLPYYQDDNPESPNKAGKTETLSSYIGEKKIMLNFWSTFCGACIGEFPLIRGIYEDENLAGSNSEDSDFAVFTVCIDSKIDEAPARIKTLEGKFIDEAGPFTFPILFDTVGQTKKDYHIWTIPETVFIDTDGIIRKIKIGRFQSKEEIEAILKALD